MRVRSSASAAGGLGYWVAAVRETFEEAGVLLARTAATGELVDPAEPRLAKLRDELNAGAITFQDLIESEDLVLDVAGLHAFSHWITPEGAPRRYDTRFFLAAAPDGHAYLHDETETVASHWLRPADALVASDARRPRADLPDPQEPRGAEPLHACRGPARPRSPRRPMSRPRTGPGSCRTTAGSGCCSRSTRPTARAPDREQPDGGHGSRGAERPLAARAPDRGGRTRVT